VGAITSGVRDLQSVLNVVWDKLLPAYQSAPLPPDDAARTKLERALKGVSLRPPQGSGTPAVASRKRYTFPANDRKLEALTLESNVSNGVTTLVARIDGVERRIDCGRGEWRKGRPAWFRMPEQPGAACGAWTGDDTFTAKLSFTETPFVVTVRMKFTEGEVRLDSEANVGFGSTRGPQLIGKAE
jgi:hypothetical protein